MQAKFLLIKQFLFVAFLLLRHLWSLCAKFLIVMYVGMFSLSANLCRTIDAVDVDNDGFDTSVEAEPVGFRFCVVLPCFPENKTGSYINFLSKNNTRRVISFIFIYQKQNCVVENYEIFKYTKHENRYL